MNIDDSFNEMLASNKRNGTYVWSIWNESLRDKGFIPEALRKYCKWFNPKWKLPNQAYPIIEAFEHVFGGCKLTIYDNREGLPVHMHISNWLDGWSYVIGIPYDGNLNHEYELRYCDYQDKYLFDEELAEVYNNKFKTLTLGGGSRTLFAGSRIPHGVLPTKDRWLFILYDLKCVGEVPFKSISSKHLDITNKQEMIDDMQGVLTKYPSLENAPLSELWYIRHKLPNPKLDYIPL